MPYIGQGLRANIDKALKEFLMQMGLMTPGEFVYIMYQMALWQASAGGVENLPASWADASRVVADLECTKLEFYRRVVAPYEDTKIFDPKNGDVQPIRAANQTLGMKVVL